MEDQQSSCLYNDEQEELIVFLTGFGKFGKQLQNPTSKLSEAIQTVLAKDPIENLKIHRNYVITVSIEHCDEALNDIYRQVNEILSIESNQNKKVLVIHFGVYKGCGSFQLEMQGRNIKNFGIPDENGNQPRD
jgi:pyrrolidone-carboxylate peptidase